ncbi:uncharacterized protein LOC119179453 isoform X1 [Rhipicephalus microplus]|uniref:uncharacterized protein LOC119179453 isoform X1 n=1 Tax=Rhipicephalus microplus TaxID=6941 RepID=UPI003F6CF68F
MKFNGAPKRYVPLPQSQSDDEVVRLDDRQVQRRSSAALAGSGAVGTANGRVGAAPERSACAAHIAMTRLESKQADASSVPDWSSEGTAPLSVWRKCCLALSLACSALFVIGLGWLLPCRYDSLQPLESVPSVMQHWTHLYQGLALTSNVEASFEDDVERDCTVHLGFQQYSEHNETATVGVMALNGMTGSVMWKQELYAAAVRQQCLLDVCFVLGDGSNSLLAAVNKSSGALLWYAHDHGSDGQLGGSTLQSVSDFHVVTDCNDDGLPDLVVSMQVEKPSTEPFSVSKLERALALISQDDGRLLKAPLSLPQCQNMPRILGSLEHGRNISHHVDVFVHCVTHHNKSILLKVALSRLSSVNRTDSEATTRVMWSSKGKSASGHGLQLVVLQEDEEPSLILAWGHGKLLKLSGIDYHQRWSTDLKLDSPVRSVVAGHFTAFSTYELFVVSDHGTRSRATLFQLLSASTGHVSWQMQYDGTATRVAHLVPAISRYVDGVLIKATSPLADAMASRHDLDLWTKKLQEPKYAHYMETFHGIRDYNPEKHQLVLNTQEEQYFIVDFTNKTVDIMARLTVQQLCFGTKCAPDIFSTKENVAMQVLQHRPGSYYLSLATTSANRRSNASVPHDTVVKVALLSHQHPPPTQPQTKLALGSANAAAALLVHDKHCCRP